MNCGTIALTVEHRSMHVMHGVKSARSAVPVAL